MRNSTGRPSRLWLHAIGTDLTFATPGDAYHALAYTVRDRLIQRWLDTLHAGIDSQARFVCYLSAEYLIGRQLDNNLLTVSAEKKTRSRSHASIGCGSFFALGDDGGSASDDPAKRANVVAG